VKWAKAEMKCTI